MVSLNRAVFKCFLKQSNDGVQSSLRRCRGRLFHATGPQNLHICIPCAMCMHDYSIHVEVLYIVQSSICRRGLGRGLTPPSGASQPQVCIDSPPEKIVRIFPYPSSPSMVLNVSPACKLTWQIFEGFSLFINRKGLSIKMSRYFLWFSIPPPFCHMIFTPCLKLSHSLRPPPPRAWHTLWTAPNLIVVINPFLSKLNCEMFSKYHCSTLGPYKTFRVMCAVHSVSVCICVYMYTYMCSLLSAQSSLNPRTSVHAPTSDGDLQLLYRPGDVWTSLFNIVGIMWHINSVLWRLVALMPDSATRHEWPRCCFTVPRIRLNSFQPQLCILDVVVKKDRVFDN